MKRVFAAFMAAVFAGACTNTYLFDERRDDQLPRDRALTLEGEFCTPSPNEIIRPIKIVIAMDASQSMNVTVDASKFNAPVKITAPPAAEVSDR